MTTAQPASILALDAFDGDERLRVAVKKTPGKRFTKNSTGKELIEFLRENGHSVRKINGVIVDAFTVSGVLSIYDHIEKTKPEVRAKLDGMNWKTVLIRLSDLAFKYCTGGTSR